MKRLNSKSRYQFISLLYELLLFFISSFILFPSHVKIIILCFVYSEDYQPSFINPSLEEDLQPACIVEVKSVFVPQFIYKNDLCIQIPSESDQPCNLEEIKTDSKPIQSSTFVAITSEPCQQIAIPHDQPTTFQIKIRMKMFKPLRLPYLLHPYPLDCYEYLPWFSGENQASAERHLESFVDFIDRFQIVHEDVIMRFFSKSLIKDVAIWFKNLRADSIGSWIEFSDVFMKHWGEHKTPDSYLADFYALKREHNETLSAFHRRFCSIYHAMPLEIRPTETAAMIYYVMGLQSKLSLLLLERKSLSLNILFEDALEVEENICASRRIPEQVDFENHHLPEPTECQYSSESEQEGSEYETDMEQQPEGEYISDSESDSSVCAEYSRDRYESEVYDQFVNQNESMVTDDCIGNYIFLADHYRYDLNSVLSLSNEHHSEEMIVTIDDQDPIIKELESPQFSNRKTIIAKQEAAIDIQLFPEYQQISDFSFKDPVAAFIELYISERLKVSDFFSLHVFFAEFGCANNFYPLLLHFKHQVLINRKDEIITVLKLLGWLLWKSAFT
jgi:hypothetical protein